MVLVLLSSIFCIRLDSSRLGALVEFFYFGFESRFSVPVERSCLLVPVRYWYHSFFLLSWVPEFLDLAFYWHFFLSQLLFLLITIPIIIDICVALYHTPSLWLLLLLYTIGVTSF